MPASKVVSAFSHAHASLEPGFRTFYRGSAHTSRLVGLGGMEGGDANGEPFPTPRPQGSSFQTPHLLKALAQDLNDSPPPLPPIVPSKDTDKLGSGTTPEPWKPALAPCPVRAPSHLLAWAALVLLPAHGKCGGRTRPGSRDPGGYRRGRCLAPSSA